MRKYVYASRPDARLNHIYKWTNRVLAECDRNVIFSTAQEGIHFEYYEDVEGFSRIPFSHWLKWGNDKDYVLSDPLLVDAANEDFRLSPDSPALKLSFQPIDMSKIRMTNKCC